MTQGDDPGKDRAPGGDAMQRRRAFLEQRGLPLDDETDETDETEDGAPSEEEEDQAQVGEEEEDPGDEDSDS